MCPCVHIYIYMCIYNILSVEGVAPELLWSGRFRRTGTGRFDSLACGFTMIDCGRRIETSCKGQRKDGDKLAFWEEDLVDNRCSPQVVCRLYMHALLRLGGSLMHLNILVILRS